ncbi:MAG: SufD family Fe-S cluster assembly protein [Robiginitomaculum sp.]|nr:SufD family Fe-S cluster assembly protein [Robiginitomaculum sp.]
MTKAIIETLPHRRMEAWKWTDVRAALGGEKSGLTSACEPKLTVPTGLIVTREIKSPGDSVMGKLAANFAGDAYSIIVPDGFTSGEHVNISGLNSGHARIVFKLGKGAKLHVVETHNSNNPSFVNIEVSFDLAESAHLTRTILQDDHAETTRIATTHISAWGGAKITQHSLGFGAGLTRFETRIAALGKDFECNIHGAYLLGGKRHLDMTSYIDLGAENARVRQSVKGVVTDKARGVFQGKFHVRRPAQLADAEMRHDAIMLSDTAHIRAKPELEIYADDVACAHGNTIGALDETALFYMRTRGIPLGEARALLTQAFVAGAFDGMDDNKDFMSRITAWLEQNS